MPKKKVLPSEKSSKDKETAEEKPKSRSESKEKINKAQEEKINKKSQEQSIPIRNIRRGKSKEPEEKKSEPKATKKSTAKKEKLKEDKNDEYELKEEKAKRTNKAAGKRGRDKSHERESEDIEDSHDKKKAIKEAESQSEEEENLYDRPDKEVLVPGLEVVKERNASFGLGLIIPNPEDPGKEGTWVIQLLKDPSAKNEFYNFQRKAKHGEAGKWELRGSYGIKRAKEVHKDWFQAWDKEFRELDAQVQVAKKEGGKKEKETEPDKPEGTTIAKLDGSSYSVDEFVPRREEMEVLQEGIDVLHTVLNKESGAFKIVQALRNKSDHNKHYLYVRTGKEGTKGEWIISGTYSEAKVLDKYVVEAKS